MMLVQTSHYGSVYTLLAAIVAFIAVACPSRPASAEQVNGNLLAHTQVIFKDKKAWAWNSDQARAIFAEHESRGVYLFLHGSGGVNKREFAAVAEAVVPHGYVAVMPDYKSSYHGWFGNETSSNWRDFVRRRASDTKDLVSYLRTLPWVDKDRIVLHGQSAGAILLADFDWGGFSAAIFTGFNCIADKQTTIDFPKNIPALSLQDPEDPTFGAKRVFSKGGPTYGTCEKEMNKRENSYVIEYPGGGHKTLYDPKAIQDIRAFLRSTGLLE